MGLYDPSDQGANLAGLYQEDAANKIQQANKAKQLGYDQSYAKQYGLSDVAASVKGKSDVDLYKLATDLVTQRRKKLGIDNAGKKIQPVKPAKAKPKPRVKPAPAPKHRTKKRPKTVKSSATIRPKPAPKKKAHHTKKQAVIKPASGAALRY